MSGMKRARPHAVEGVAPVALVLAPASASAPHPPESDCANGVRLYAHASLGARPLSQLVGVRAAKDALDAMIERRRRARAVYAPMRLRRALVLCGAEGAGKRTLVRAYCRERALSLVELSEYAGALTPLDVERAYECALANAPCVVLVRGCDASLLETRPCAQRSTLRARLEACELAAGVGGGECGVWSVLALECAYTELALTLRERVCKSLWLAPASYVPAGASGPADNFRERRALIALLMGERARVQDIAKTELYAGSLEALIAASHNTTPRQLATFLDDVFDAHLQTYALDKLLSTSALDLLPSAETLVSHFCGGAPHYVTRERPEARVVAPYRALANLA